MNFQGFNLSFVRKKYYWYWFF